jgi:hypothetical protein
MKSRFVAWIERRRMRRAEEHLRIQRELETYLAKRVGDNNKILTVDQARMAEVSGEELLRRSV